jgi:hypothetical protein
VFVTVITNTATPPPSTCAEGPAPVTWTSVPDLPLPPPQAESKTKVPSATPAAKLLIVFN